MPRDGGPQDGQLDRRHQRNRNEARNDRVQRLENTTIQKTAAAIITLLILFLIVSWVLCLAALTVSKNYADFPEIGLLENSASSSTPSLYWPWDVFLWFAIKGEVLGKALASVLAILSLGSQFLATLHRKLWSVLAICGSCFAGIVCAIVILIWVDVVELRSFVDGGTDESVQTSIYAFVAVMISWFGVFMATQLGISLNRPAGVLKRMIRNQ